MRPRVVGGFVVAIGLLCRIVSAQPVTPDPVVVPVPTSTDATTTGGRTEMSVNMPTGTEVLNAEGAATSTRAAAVALEQPIDPDSYVCGPGDVFELNFWGQQNFRLRVSADLEGRTFISKVGYVPVYGKTLTAVRAEVKKKVRGTYPGLQFDLTLISPRTFLVHVVENVRTPGTFAATPLDRVSSLINRAGGITGSRRQILITRKSGTHLTADLLMYELTGNTEYNPYVLDGDVVSVPIAEVVVSISGGVRRPGTYELIKTKDLNELLTLAGGLTSSAARSLPIRVIRHNDSQQETVENVAFFGANPGSSGPLHDEDKIIVRTNDELQRSVLLIGAVVGTEEVDAATTSKRLPYIEGDTVLSLIERAGGIKAPGDLKRAYISRPNKTGPATLINVDLEALLVRRDFHEDKPIEINDTIVVPPMKYSVLVEGAVGRAGLYNFNPVFGIREYIARAGGRTRTAQTLDNVQLIDSSGITHDYNSSLKPAPGDAILVPERNFTRPEVVQIALAAAGLLLSGVAITLAVTR